MSPPPSSTKHTPKHANPVRDPPVVGRSTWGEQNVGVAFTFNGMGIPLAATGLVHPVWAMAASVTAIFINSIGGRPSLLFAAIGSVGRTTQPDQPAADPHTTDPSTPGTTGAVA